MSKSLRIIKIPEELSHELDQLAGTRRRTAYAIDVLWREVRRHKQRRALETSKGAWKTKDHPELSKGGAAHVDRIRSEPDERFETALRHQKG